MDILRVRKEINQLLNSIKEHSESIENEESISQLELEHFLSKIEHLQKKLIVLSYLNSLPNNTINPKNLFTPLEENENKDEIIAEPLIDFLPKEIVPNEELLQTEKVIEVKAPVDEVHVLVDLFEENLPTNTKAPETEKKEDKFPHNKIQKPPLTDIKVAIGINDKFQFINELFKGNGQEYETAIQRLNASETEASAISYFSDLEQSYGWKDDSETKNRLRDLVERRYS
jgi:hypothetical protein